MVENTNEKALSNDVLTQGVDLAEKALMWCFWCHGKITAAQAREAIRALFGTEVEAALETRIQRKQVAK